MLKRRVADLGGLSKIKCTRCNDCIASFRCKYNSEMYYLCSMCYGGYYDTAVLEEFNFFKDVGYSNNFYSRQFVANHTKLQLIAHTAICRDNKTCSLGERCYRTKQILKHSIACNLPDENCITCKALRLLQDDHSFFCVIDDCATCEEKRVLFKYRRPTEEQKIAYEKLTTEEWTALVYHREECTSINCRNGALCFEVDRRIRHYALCLRKNDNCEICAKFSKQLAAHAFQCLDQKCIIRGCKTILKEEYDRDLSKKRLAAEEDVVERMKTAIHSEFVEMPKGDLDTMHRIFHHGVDCDPFAKNSRCLSQECFYAKKIIAHVVSCRIQQTEKCTGCRCVFAIFREHSKMCRAGSLCVMPFCVKIKRMVVSVMAKKRNPNLVIGNKNEESVVTYLANLDKKKKRGFKYSSTMILYVFQGIVRLNFEDGSNKSRPAKYEEYDTVYDFWHVHDVIDKQPPSESTESLDENYKESEVLLGALSDPFQKWALKCILFDTAKRAQALSQFIYK